MKRERQRLQDLYRYGGDSTIKFHSNSETVEQLDRTSFKETVIVPGRREGQQHAGEQIVQRLATTALYEYIEQLAIRPRSEVHPLYIDESWTIEEMPDRVQDEYGAWLDTIPLDEADFRKTLKEISLQPVDRMTARDYCPHCPKDTKYACYTSGWSRELYKYPMVRLRAEESGRLYEAPLDAALLAEHHPDTLTCGVRPQFSNEGKMSADFIIEMSVAEVSKEYVEAATNRLVLPEEKTLSVLSRGRYKLSVAEWRESGYRRNLRDFHHTELAADLQKVIMMDHAERVTDTDYNAMFERARQYMGSRGLSLAFRQTTRFGEVSAEFMALTEQNDEIDIVEGEDVYWSLEKMNDLVKEKIT